MNATEQAKAIQAARELLELADKTSPAGWFVTNYRESDFPALIVHSDDDNRICFMATATKRADQEVIESNAAFIAHARNTGPAIAQALIEAEARIKALEAENFALAAAHCPNKSGDDRGNPWCLQIKAPIVDCAVLTHQPKKAGL